MAEKHKSQILPIILAIGLIAVGLFAAIGPRGGFEGDLSITQLPSEPTITVSGEATVTVTPDEAQMYIGVRTDAATAEEAQQENANIMDDVMSALKSEGIASADIETSYFSVYPNYDWVGGRSVLRGYTAQHELRVTTENLEKVGDYLDTASAAGANDIGDIRFDLSEESQAEVRNDALSEAAQNAESKADAIAGSLGVNVGEVLSVSESYSYYPAPRYAGGFEVMAMEEAAPTQISPENIEVSASVTIQYRIE
jgi:uncharacterized protein YggE